MNNSKNCFNLKSNNADFIKRQKNIFDQLKVLESNRRNVTIDDQIELNEQIDCSRRTQRSITKHFRGKESIFKKPQNPAPNNFINRMPDFKKNPHKWTKYSLEDVKEEDMSDKGNARAALSFLKELEDRKGYDVECCVKKNVPPTKIVFKKRSSTNVSKDSNLESSKSSFRCSKVIMPEYVVGQKMKKEKRHKSYMYNMYGKEKGLKLDHLLNEEGD